MLELVNLSKDFGKLKAVCEIIHQRAPDAFVTIEDTQKVEHGYLRAAHHER